MESQYFLGNRYLGASTVRHFWDGKGEVLVNSVFICPSCGDVWGRAINWPDGKWMPVMRGCRKHASANSDIGGSFLASWQQSLAGLSREVLEYELNLRLDAYEAPAKF